MMKRFQTLLSISTGAATAWSAGSAARQHAMSTSVAARVHMASGAYHGLGADGQYGVGAVGPG
jgi:hypothetical protein